MLLFELTFVKMYVVYVCDFKCMPILQHSTQNTLTSDLLNYTTQKFSSSINKKLKFKSKLKLLLQLYAFNGTKKNNNHIENEKKKHS